MCAESYHGNRDKSVKRPMIAMIRHCSGSVRISRDIECVACHDVRRHRRRIRKPPTIMRILFSSPARSRAKDKIPRTRGETREYLHKPSDCSSTVWRGPKLIDWWKCRMAVGHAQQLVSSGLHSATKCHVTCVCTLNTMHENTRAGREALSTSRCKAIVLNFGAILIFIQYR
ncbi:PREDICTED: uncharacterized protein LOC105454750 isoform X1 [Wasmannia auropunctata]|uniref:uncharacterized protein LOC105454750 isoform X1 n=1 Tax=Wasmannia auropunctata TaxID=64793 RepID=UPI0005EE9F4C|nr:PREDICTED: uncharacterized protein LOC105454750 isoform X1 [Wasmannia auropunctata]